MLKEFLFKVTKEQYVKVVSDNKDDAYDLAEEKSFMNIEDEIISDIELIDINNDYKGEYYDEYFEQ